MGLLLLRSFRRQDFQFFYLWWRRKQIFRLGEQLFGDFSGEVSVPGVFVGEGIEDAVPAGPSFTAYQEVVPVSCKARGRADLRKSSTSFSLPGFTCSIAKSAR
jgi:hypothetical protein